MGDSLFIGSCKGSFYAINKSSGAVRWSYDIRNDGNQQSFHGDPLVAGDLILVGTDKSCAPDGIGHVYAFDRATGNALKPHSRRVLTSGIKLDTGSRQSNLT